MFRGYSYQLPVAGLAPPDVVWQTVTRKPLGQYLAVYSNGAIQGVPVDAGSFEFLVEATGSVEYGDGGGFEVFQNVLLTVELDAGSGQ